MPLTLLQHLRTDNSPFILRRDRHPPKWQDAPLHQSAYEGNPQLYALLALIKTVQPWQKVRILFQLLQTSRNGMSQENRRLLDRVVAFLLAILHPDRILTVFLALKRVRANHKHSVRTILHYILNHPHSQDMAICRRPAVVDCLEHAMGKNVARACGKMLSSATAEEQYLRRHLLRLARTPESAKQIFPLLYRQNTPQTGNNSYQLTHSEYSEKLDTSHQRPKTVTATNRGDIAATLVHLYRGGKSEQLQQAVDRYVEDARQKLPQFPGQIALVLDASASSRAYGEREFCLLSQSVALQMVLEKCSDKLEVHYVGGDGYPPMPAGNTDLALALLDALASKPDLVAIVSDGYENVYPGDLARVVAALPGAGVETPIVFCHSKFSAADDLTLRSPALSLPQLEFWHQDDFEDLLLSMFSMVNGKKSETCLQQFLLQKLDRVEKELAPWTAIA